MSSLTLGIGVLISFQSCLKVGWSGFRLTTRLFEKREGKGGGAVGLVELTVRPSIRTSLDYTSLS